MSLMKTSLTIIPMCPRERFPLYKSFPSLSFATNRIGPPCCTLVTFITCYPFRITLSQNYLLPIISVLAENTLLKTAYHFLLLLVGFNTLTYQKGYNRSPTLVGHHLAVEGTMTALPVPVMFPVAAASPDATVVPTVTVATCEGVIEVEG